MKTKHMILTALLALLGLNTAVAQEIYSDDVAPSQNVREMTDKERKEFKKNHKNEIDSVRFARAIEALNDGYYVVQFTSLDSYGYMAAGLSPDANFLVVQGDRAIFQTAALNGRMGYNGMGGMTLTGQVRNVKIKTGKKGDVTCHFTLYGRNVNAAVQINIPHNGANATVFFSPNFGRGRLTAYGRLSPYSNPELKIRD